jgi:AcrR family transcriptional regulator
VSTFSGRALTGPLPPGRHRLAREVVTASQRGRLLDALAEVVARRGYAAATIADIVREAQVSRSTFYEHFSSKEECFLAAYDAGVEVLLGAIAERAAEAEGWREQVIASIDAYLEVLAVEPAFARTMMVEAMAAGEAALERRRRMHERLAGGLRRLHQAAQEEDATVPELPDLAYAAIIRGVDGVLAEEVRAGRHASLPALRDDLVRWHLVNLAGS